MLVLVDENCGSYHLAKICEIHDPQSKRASACAKYYLLQSGWKGQLERNGFTVALVATK